MDVVRWCDWVSSGMLLEETRMCGADAKLGLSCYSCVTCYILCYLSRHMLQWMSVAGLSG
jgi:hypothetical protein